MMSAHVGRGGPWCWCVDRGGGRKPGRCRWSSNYKLTSKAVSDLYTSLQAVPVRLFRQYTRTDYGVVRGRLMTAPKAVAS